MAVVFRRLHTGKLRSGTVVARLRRTTGFMATVPLSARSGHIRVVARNGRRSNAVGPILVKTPTRPLESSVTPFDGTGMWIWYVSRSDGGDPNAIVAKALQHGVRTVFIKSSDGATWWGQFSTELVAALKAGGLRVCAWQFVYGSRPSTEAALGARAAATGADCLVIDAESAYEGKYASAQTYVDELRAGVGPAYPVALAGFPYVDYHPGFPYSVFFRPGGAQYSVPQLYWKSIGTTVDRAFAHTYLWNAVYQRPIFPLGQLYGRPRPSEVERFRELAFAYGATGLSWWSWQSASAEGWSTIALPMATPLGPPRPGGYPELGLGARGDVVVWAQEHLIAAGQALEASGIYDSLTVQAVRNVQAANGLPVTGRLDAATWPALLSIAPAAIDWQSGARVARAAGERRGGPRSARLAPLRNELAGRSAAP